MPTRISAWIMAFAISTSYMLCCIVLGQRWVLGLDRSSGMKKCTLGSLLKANSTVCDSTVWWWGECEDDCKLNLCGLDQGNRTCLNGCSWDVLMVCASR